MSPPLDNPWYLDAELVNEILERLPERHRLSLLRNFAPLYRKKPRPKPDLSMYWWSYQLAPLEESRDTRHGPYVPAYWKANCGRRIHGRPSLEEIEETYFDGYFRVFLNRRHYGAEKWESSDDFYAPPFSG